MKNKIKNTILLIFCIYSLFFLIGSILAPIMAHFKQYDLSGILTATYMFSCHQRPERSFWIFDYPVALCCRCLGFYLGIILSSLVALIKKQYLPIKTFYLLLFTSLIDILSNCIFKINTHKGTRFFIGIIMGTIFVTLICYGFKHKKEKKMSIKKLTCLALLFSFVTLTMSPLTAATTSNKNESLSDFLKTTDKIKASYSYPSMILASNGTGKSILPAHTPIIIRCEETITTKDIVSGGTVHFSVVNDVKNSNGTILIKAGSPVSAQISFSRDNGLIGRSGQLTISDFHTIAVDGSYIPLSGTVSANPDDKMALSVVLSVLICPLFLLMKGDEARLPAGTTKTAYTISETYIKAVRL